MVAQAERGNSNETKSATREEELEDLQDDADDEEEEDEEDEDEEEEDEGADEATISSSEPHGRNIPVV